MGSWRDAAAAALGERSNPPAPPAVENFGLPDALATSLRTLEYMPAPKKIHRAESWRAVVADALTIARSGWAAKALALGWTAGDLYGIGPHDDWEFSGLAVWLRGRPIVLLDERYAIVTDVGHRASFRRGGMGHGIHPAMTPVMLWEFGRDR